MVSQQGPLKGVFANFELCWDTEFVYGQKCDSFEGGNCQFLGFTHIYKFFA